MGGNTGCQMKSTTPNGLDVIRYQYQPADEEEEVARMMMEEEEKEDIFFQEV